MKLTVHFIRHGESQANALQNKFGCFHVCLRDPDLTKSGKQVTQNITVPDVDVVCCSTLKRAKETAKLSYPHKFIYVLPGIQELGFGLDNIPRDFMNQFSTFRDVSSFIHLQQDESCVDFLDYLKKYLLKHKSNDISIALFTHQRFIAKYTDNKKAKNNEIITKVYQI